MGYTDIHLTLQVQKEKKRIAAEISQLKQEMNISYRQIFLNTGVDYFSIKKIENGLNYEMDSYLKVRLFLGA